MTDMINPSHYRGGRKFEPIEVIEDWGLNYRLGNALKYLSRNGRKPGEDPCEGLRKAIWYLEREIKSLEQHASFAVSYSDILENAAYEASLGNDLEHSYELYIPRENSAEVSIGLGQDVDDQPLEHWGAAQPVPFDATEDILSWDIEDILWDPSLGPVDLTEDEIRQCLGNKDLDQFDDDDIVSIFERRGLVLGVKKDGSSVLLTPENK